MIKYKNNINVGTGSVGYEADATSAAPLDSVSGGKVVKSEGRTVKWNQLVQNGDFSDGTTRWVTAKGTISVSDNILTYTTWNSTAEYMNVAQSNVNPARNHKIYISCSLKAELDCTCRLLLYRYESSMHEFLVKSDGWTLCRYITSDTKSGQETTADFVAYAPNINNFSIYLKNVVAFDLTAIFGAGNEPTTVEAFESWLAENMVEQDYYPYCAGSLVPVVVKGVKRDVGGTTVTNPMPVTTLVDDNDVVMFPDGLKSAGSVKDEIDWEHGVAVKRVGVVDLGDLNWSYIDGIYRTVPPSNIANIFNTRVNGVENAINEKYGVLNWTAISSLKDKSIAMGTSFLFVIDSNYSDVDTFTTAMQGVLLYYELATPITYHFATHTELKKRVVKIGESVEVDGIEGETVVWNQLFKAEGSPTILMLRATSTTTSTGFILTPTDYGIETSVCGFYIVNAVSEGHKVYKAANFSSNTTGLHAFANNGDNIGTQPTRCREIYTQGSNANVLFYAYGTMESTTNITIENCVCIDLTLMFGSGNEPATVAEFEAWLSAHGGIKDYYPYCAGELKDKEEGNVRGVGFNLWDEEWEEGQIKSDTGEEISTTFQIRSKNYIPISPSTSYYGRKGSATYLFAFWYDTNKNYISYSGISNKSATSPSNAAYMRFHTSGNPAYGSTYNHDICFNLSDPSRNGTYVPYKSITRSVDLTTLKGKVDGAGEDVVMFPDGMKQAGSVKDEIFVEGGVVKAVKRVGTVDLGELSWMDVGVDNIFKANKVNLGMKVGGYMICPKYTRQGSSSLNDKEAYNGDYYGSNYFVIKDTAYSTAADFTTAMQGVMLNYELASPVTYVVNMQGMEMAEVRKVMVGTQKVWEKP